MALFRATALPSMVNCLHPPIILRSPCAEYNPHRLGNTLPFRPCSFKGRRVRRSIILASIAPSPPVGQQQASADAPKVSLGTCQIAREREPELRANLIHGVELFLETWNEEIKTIPTYVGDPSHYSFEELTVLNQSRHIYGLCKAATAAKKYYPEKSKRFLDVAEMMATSYADHFLDRVNLCFNEVFDVGTWAPKETPLLTVNFQAYALGGVAALYQERLGAVDLRMGRRLYNSFHQRFHDKAYGGYWLKSMRARESGSTPSHPKYGNTGMKGYDSVVYVISSLLRDTAVLDRLPEPPGYRGPPRPNYEAHLLELGDIIIHRMIGTNFGPGGCGFITERFKGDWTEYWPVGDGEWQRQEVDGKSYTIGIVGHNLQTSWVLLDLYAKFGKEAYMTAALKVLCSMMDRGYDRQHGGFFNAVKREAPPLAPDALMWGSNKSWWQQCMGLQALMLADMLGVLDQVVGPVTGVTGREALQRSFDFWRNFQNKVSGTWQEVQADGTPVQGQMGSPGKATYHIAQLWECSIMYSQGNLQCPSYHPYLHKPSFY